MIIRRIRLVNFRKFSNLELELPQGLVGIIGPNGAGKTTILEAIAFAFYGNNASRTKGKGVRRDGCPPNAICTVELDFAFRGESYTIIREIHGETESQRATVYRGGTRVLEAHQSHGVDNWVQRLLGMDYKTFIRSIFARQKEVALLTDEKPEERRRAVRRMMGIDQIEQAYKLAREDKRDKEKFVEGARIAIRDLDKMVEEHKGVSQTLEEIVPRLDIAEKQVKQRRAAAEAAQKAFTVQEQKQQEFNRLENQRGKLKTDISNAIERKEKLDGELKDLEEKQNRLKELGPQLTAYEKARLLKEQLDKAQGSFEERRSLASEIARIKQDIGRTASGLDRQRTNLSKYTGLDEKLKTSNKEIRSTEIKLKTVDSDLRRNQSSLDKKIALIQQLDGDKKRVQAEGSKGKCPTCLRPIGESYSEIMEHFRKEKQTLEKSKKGLKSKVLALKKGKTKLDNKLRKFKKGREVLSTKKNDRKVALANVNLSERSLQEKRDVLNRNQTHFKSLSKTKYSSDLHHRAEREFKLLSTVYEESIKLKRDSDRIPALHTDLQQNTARLSKATDDVKGLEGELETLAFDPQAYNKARSTYQSANQELADSQTATGKVRQEVAVLRDRQTRLEAEIQQKQKLKKQIDAEQKAVQYLAQLEFILKDFQSNLINRIRPLIANRASLLLDRVTNGRYSRIDLDEDYGISIVDDGVTYPIKRFSGGEEDLANLSLRIAISQIISERMTGAGTGLIALDEVFGSQDRERRERLLQALQNLTGSFGQILFITHIEDLQERVPNVLHIYENRDRTSVAEWVI